MMDTLTITLVSAVSSQRKEWNLRYHESHIEVQIKERLA